MARISGVNIPTNKKVNIAQTYIFGIGRKIATDICADASIDLSKRVSELNDEELNRIRDSIDKNYSVEGDLRRKISVDIKRLNDLGCYRGLRHRKKLPVRGQRTHTNARTRKGKAIAIAGKKKLQRVKMAEKKKIKRKSVIRCCTYSIIFNNTIITISDDKGNA